VQRSLSTFFKKITLDETKQMMKDECKIFQFLADFAILKFQNTPNFWKDGLPSRLPDKAAVCVEPVDRNCEDT
jgi:hypothetical protein